MEIYDEAAQINLISSDLIVLEEFRTKWGVNKVHAIDSYARNAHIHQCDSRVPPSPTHGARSLSRDHTCPDRF